ncbi:MAG TPA: lipopolysaccharide heptosyltransferase II [Noviherbaspirillum sp.]|jgi:lipopolysaccharide heptosyltransferase II|uniref:lipopolysaccharide heptosyltransferase II n=1 Tax=Noviherbaspirillum sp. TaxID=1926288 RepID=UPI002F93D6EE
MNDQQWRQARRVLCIRLDYLGDVLMTSPAIRALRESLPGCHITLLTSGSGAAAARYIPEIDDTIVYAAPWLKSSTPHGSAQDMEMIARLAAGRFDAAVIFTVYSQNPLPAAMFCYLAGIPLRLAHCRENPYQLLTNWVRDTEPQENLRHEVQRQLDLVASVGARTADERLSFTPGDADRRAVRERLDALGIDRARPWAVVHPGATAASRRYPPELFREAARRLQSRTGCQLVFTGGADEAELVEQVRAGMPGTHSLAGALQLGELAALLAEAPLLISNNTGPAHIAAAVGTPVVDLYALTNPQHTPWQVPSRVLYQEVDCAFCYKSACPHGHNRCLAGVTPEQVANAAIELLQGGRQQEPNTAVVRIPVRARAA